MKAASALAIIMAFYTFTFSANAKDVALILSDAEQQELVQVLDGAAKGQGILLATQVSHILEKLKLAPVVKETTADSKDDTK